MFCKELKQSKQTTTKKNQQKYNSMDDNRYLKNICKLNIPLKTEFAKEQSYEVRNLTLIEVTMF